MKTYGRGFTLVELLIVIVVISILAGVTVTAFRGVQGRAHMASAGAARASVVKLLKIYKQEHGGYPKPASNDTVCIGEAASYPAANGFVAGQCQYSDYTATSVSTDAALTATLQTYGKTPFVNWPPATEDYAFEGSGKDFYRGLFYMANSGVGTTSPTAYLWFYIPGQNTCPAGVGYGGYNSDTGETQCTIYLT